VQRRRRWGSRRGDSRGEVLSETEAGTNTPVLTSHSRHLLPLRLVARDLEKLSENMRPEDVHERPMRAHFLHALACRDLLFLVHVADHVVTLFFARASLVSTSVSTEV